jgi:ribose/xylose/arabinose/galactoside ABC-type transport system permease subunit
VEHSPLRVILMWLFVAPGVWITLILAAVMSIVLSFTRFGRHLIAIGSNEQTARLCGIPVNRTKIFVYTIGGIFAGCAALLQYSRTNQGSPTANVGLELDVIAAAVIGGASLSGGKGSILGTIIGSLIMTLIGRGCSQVPIPHFLRPLFDNNPTGLPTYIQEIVTGCIIIIAVAVDRMRQRWKE